MDCMLSPRKPVTFSHIESLSQRSTRRDSRESTLDRVDTTCSFRTCFYSATCNYNGDQQASCDSAVCVRTNIDRHPANHRVSAIKHAREGVWGHMCTCVCIFRLPRRTLLNVRLFAEFSARAFFPSPAHIDYFSARCGQRGKRKRWTDSQSRDTTLRNTVVFPLPRAANKLTLFTDSRNSARICKRAKIIRRHMGYAQ